MKIWAFDLAMGTKVNSHVSVVRTTILQPPHPSYKMRPPLFVNFKPPVMKKMKRNKWIHVITSYGCKTNPVMHGRTDFPSAGLRVRTSTIYVICSCSLKSKDKISKAECTLFQLTDPKFGPLIFCKSYIYRLHSISFFLKIQLLQMLMWILRYN